MDMHEFSVISGQVVRDIIGRRRSEIVREVRQTYLAHDNGESVNPNSYFLRFPDKPDSRIIALPAYLGGRHNIAGIKWIGSFPANIARGEPRASAILVLNEYDTGYPFALIEASQISAARTAASAVIAAEVLISGTSAGRLAVVGAGVIGRNILDFLGAEGWTLDSVVVYDRVTEYSVAMGEYASSRLGYPSHVAGDLTAALSGADLVVLTTTAAEPYITSPDAFAPSAVVLNISLRDISPQIIYHAYNIVDDIDHCLRAGSSPHLTEQLYGNRDFITGTIAQLLKGEVTIGPDRPAIFSPFGLGVLDLAVGSLIYQEAIKTGEVINIRGFFGETSRW
jgi:ornithine cyclodeaminase